MSQKGLRFTLDVDGLTPTATAVVSFTLYQNLSTPFLLSVDIASDRSGLTAVSFLEKNATLTIWQGNTPQRYLHGIITGMETGENNDWQMNYSDGKIDWSAEYDAWGNMLSENNPHNLKQLIRLPGLQYDAETGLYYNRHRYYDPLQGRYTTQDPIGLLGGWNLYQYPLDPITDIDPLGLFVPILVGLACGLVFDYTLDQWKEEHCKDPDADTAFGQAGNAASGAAVGTFGGFENRPRGGIAGGGPSGNKTSVYSKTVHNAYKNKVINKETTRVLRNGGRRVAKAIPYVGTAITLYQFYDASNCDD